VCLSVIVKRRQWGGPGLLGAVAPWGKYIYIYLYLHHSASKRGIMITFCVCFLQRIVPGRFTYKRITEHARILRWACGPQPYASVNSADCLIAIGWLHYRQPCLITFKRCNIVNKQPPCYGCRPVNVYRVQLIPIHMWTDLPYLQHFSWGSRGYDITTECISMQNGQTYRNRHKGFKSEDSSTTVLFLSLQEIISVPEV
jgi:hypothetical protein